MNIHVHLFAAAKEAAGRPAVQLVIPEGTTVAELRNHLIEAAPALSGFKDILLVAVNNEYAAPEAIINATDEIACFPPVSGG
jgi:molybdopterin converting factor subunit 1